MARMSKVAPRDQGEGLTNEQRINVLLQQGLDNDSIFYSLSRLRSNLETISEDDQRKKLSQKFHCECPRYNKIAHQRLLEQIRKCKSKYMKDNEELINKSRQIVRNIFENRDRSTPPSSTIIKTRMRDELSNHLYKVTKRNPIVVPVVIEV